ncbi:hypothetical protein [Glaciecola petra]|uniref:Uncharacterized protein n=1 Tax=Glaciecola petra TaxID=3075602 RepID=A0ABU2ZRI3_9ALTE|nr:hypothetical protein [Aestuariibacter sp. P117]MDT0595246.1 hypothetical protein [Aestuariibacter sp. P117]
MLLRKSGQFLIIGFVLLSIACSNTPDSNKVELSHGIDESAGGLDSYIVSISNATFYLEKEGGGLSSMLDADGVDWLGFNDTVGSGWKGEYRGFPNAVHKQDGNYFHAMNAGTDKSTSVVTIETDQHVQIMVTSGNGKWQSQYDFYPDRLDFTMTQVSDGYHYWVQYEGVPGGGMDDTDFWYASIDDKAHPINESFLGDLPAPEWFAFGDANATRMIYILHHENDQHPDNYVSRPYMTVLGFGRSEKNKFLNTPQTFSLGFAESTDYGDIEKKVMGLIN